MRQPLLSFPVRIESEERGFPIRIPLNQISGVWTQPEGTDVPEPVV
jgi:hypothetical protein